jgi:hypothetical protein
VALNAIGNSIQAAAGFRFKASADVRQGALGTSIKVKGALVCSVDINVKIVSKITIGEDGIIDVDVSDFSLDPKQFCIPGAIQLTELAGTLSPDVQKFRLLYKLFIKKELVKLINKEIRAQTADDRDLKKQITKIAQDFKDAKPIGKVAWIQVRPEEVYLSQISGDGSGPDNTTRITAGVVARPLITIGTKPKIEPSNDLKFSLASGPPGVHVLIQARLSLDIARTALESDLRSFMDERFPNSAYSLAVSNVYQSGNRMIVAVSILRRRDSHKIVTGYFSALSYLTDDNGIALRDITIDEETRKAMLRFADWLLTSGVEKFIESKTRFDLSGEIRKITKILNPFKADTGAGTMSGSCEKLSEKGIWIADKAINLLATADCRAQIEIKKVAIN